MARLTSSRACDYGEAIRCRRKWLKEVKSLGRLPLNGPTTAITCRPTASEAPPLAGRLIALLGGTLARVQRLGVDPQVRFILLTQKLPDEIPYTGNVEDSVVVTTVPRDLVILSRFAELRQAVSGVPGVYGVHHEVRLGG